MRSSAALAVTVLLAGVAVPARAQDSRVLAGGRLRLGGEGVFALAEEDRGFFNYTDYHHTLLRLARLSASAELRASDHLALLGEVRTDNLDRPEAYALYARIRPWTRRELDVQIGRIPPVFGAYSRRVYGQENRLIGQPLAYQYLLSLRPDALPATNDDLLRMRGRGWLANYPIGNIAAAPGLPMVNTSRWDTGVQAHGVAGKLEWTGAVSAGSLSDPRFRDNNSGRQIAGRLVARPTPALTFGASASRGAWLNRTIDAELAGEDSGNQARQLAFGGDAEFSSGPFLIRGEAIRSTWHLPDITTLQMAEPLVATSLLLEGRYKIAPGLYVAVRGDRIDFSRITGRSGPSTWEARTWRMEGGAGYSVTRNIQVKASWQRNNRDGGRVPHDSLVTAQALYWF
jgi:hypothetical protein